MHMSLSSNCSAYVESLLIAAQMNALRTNDIKAKIHKTQQRGRCGERNETINLIIYACC